MENEIPRLSQYGSIPLLIYWGMPILLKLKWPSDTGYTSRGYTTYWIFSVGIQTVPTHQVYSQDDQEQYIHLRTNQVKQICGLITYMKHIFESYNSGIELPDDPFHPFSSDDLGPTHHYTNEDRHDSKTSKSSWACTSPFQAHILNQTYRLLNSSDRAHGIQKGYKERNSCIPFPKR